MKILSVRLHNLNSLKGEHVVRFDQEPLASAGLFAITGPTGAGKTTLLDAITLALYGKAARYGNESNPEHVMTRHCGECSAEVEFETASGVYRAAWERHRAGKKPEGKLQPPKRYIYDAAGSPLAQQIREAEQKIEDLLGLNYDRFLRSVLLAQGDFARFLQAAPNERAELLESLTGTTIYSRLGKLANEHANALEAELKAKAAGLDQIELLDKEAREQLNNDLKEGQAEEKKLQAEIQKGEEMQSLIQQLQAARQKERLAREESIALEETRKSSAENLAKLKRHRATAPFAKNLAHLETAEAALTEAHEKSEAAALDHRDALSRLDRATAIFHISLETALTAAKQAESEAKKAAEAETKRAAESQKWLAEHQADEALSGTLGEIVGAIGDLKSARETSSRLWSENREIASRMLGEIPSEFSGKNPADWIDEWITAGAERKILLEKEGKEAKRQWQLRQDHLEKSRLVASFEEHRARLEPGEACPLCGSEEHPFAEGSPSKAGCTELEEEVSKAFDLLEAARERYSDLSTDLKRLSEGRSATSETLARVAKSEAALAHLLKPFRTEVPAPGDEAPLQRALQERVEAFRKIEKQFESSSREKEKAEERANRAADQVLALSKRRSELGDVTASEASDIAAISPEVAEQEFIDAKQSEKLLQSKRVDRKKDAESSATKSKEVSHTLSQSLADSDFATLDELRAANLSPADAAAYEKQERELADRAASGEALTKQAAKEVADLLAKDVLEGEAADAFVQRQQEWRAKRDRLLEEQTTRRNALESDDKNRKRKEESEKELESEREAFAVWRRLKELIGSHDGAKFRRYAQSISLDILTRHANRHLVKLSDRYRICRELTGELNLEIEDRHQAGAKRPMASLSGGESFLASLALALGLSDLAGRTVRIDSLFIDEGFGTLDPDSLEVAIATLESLQQDHKTVGVISHVDLLKERIGTQILVEKRPGGISEIRVVPSVG